MNKRGQIFLIAALVIVVILAGFGIYNYVTTTGDDQRVYDLSKEIKFENSKIIDYGVYSLNEINTSNRLIDTVDYYARENPDTEIIVISGDEKTLKSGNATNIFYGFKDIGGIGVGDNSDLEIKQRNITAARTEVVGDKIKVILGDGEFEFDIVDGENFYLVVMIDKQGGQYVASQ
jgi:hypothetical protein